MISTFLNIGSKRGFLNLDGRTKFIILFWGVLLVTFSPGKTYEMILISVILLLGFFGGIYSYCIKTGLFYGLMVFIHFICKSYLHGTTGVLFVSLIMLILKIIPCSLLGGLLIFTTRVNEFMFSLEWFRFPRSIVVTFAVMLRYFPAVSEDFSAIKDAMRMRGVMPGFPGFFKTPVRTLECVYVPLMFSASKISDDLAAASAVRGIENPRKRTCLRNMRFGLADYLYLTVFAVLTALLFIMSG